MVALKILSEDDVRAFLIKFGQIRLVSKISKIQDINFDNTSNPVKKLTINTVLEERVLLKIWKQRKKESPRNFTKAGIT